MLLVQRIIVIMCAKNYKSQFKFAEVIPEKVYRLLFSGHGVYIADPQYII